MQKADTCKASANIVHLLHPYALPPVFQPLEASSNQPCIKEKRCTAPREVEGIGTLVLDANMSEVVDDNVCSTFLRHMTSSGAVFLWCSHNEDKYLL